MARELAAAERGAVYGRIGTCTQEFGTHASWLVDVLNVLTGNLDREGGALFPRAAAGQRNSSGAGRQRARACASGAGRAACAGWTSSSASCRSSVLAEEIDTPGDGQVRALITVAGNPLVSTPNSGRLERAVDGLDFMLSIDIYVNETTRHADVILPGAGAAREVALRRRLLPAVRAQHRELLAGRLRARGRPPSGRSTCGWRGSSPGRARTATWTRFDDMVIQTLIQREVGHGGLARGRARPGRAPRRRSSRAAGPSGCSTSCCAPGRTATASAPTPTG